MPLSLDDLDRRLLAALQEDAGLSAHDLAQRCGSSEPTCQRRLRKLRDSGAIAAIVALLDPALSVAPLSVIIEVVLENQRTPHQQVFQQRMAGELSVSQCYMVSSEIDYLLIGHFGDIEDYHAFVERALMADNAVRNFRSMFVMKRTKFEAAIRLA